MLVKCKECGQEISSDAKVCPHCGKKRSSNGCLTSFIIVIAIFILFVIFGQCNNSTSSSLTTSTTNSTKSVSPPLKQIPYEVFKQWSIPNGGYGKVVVIKPEYVNETDMTLLGETLKYDCRNDRNAFVFILDDKKAAELRNRGDDEKRSKSSLDYIDKHTVGGYSKNGNTGHNEYNIYFDGLMGDNTKTISY